MLIASYISTRGANQKKTHASFVPIDYRQYSRAFYDWFKLLI